MWSLTSKEDRTGELTEDDHGWYRKPSVLGGGVLVLTVILYFVFG